MKSKYYLLFYCFTGLFINSMAQFKHGSLVIGFNSGTTKLDIFKYRYIPKTPNSDITYSNIQSQSFKLRGVHFGLEEINNKYYIFGGGNIAFRVSEKNSQESSTEKNFIFFKWASGWSIGEKASFLLGTQYEFNRFYAGGVNSQYNGLSSTGLDYNKENNFYFNYLGGHQYGVNLNLMLFPNSFICFRTTLFIDKITMKGIPGNVKYNNLVYKGSALRPELSLYLYRGKNKNSGLKITYTHEKRRINCTKDSQKTYVPDNTSSTNILTVSALLKAFWVKK